MIEIQDYIDPMDTRHIKGYLYMQTHGAWSERFKRQLDRDGVVFTNPSWKQLIDVKLADFWIKRHLRISEYENVINGVDYDNRS